MAAELAILKVVQLLGDLQKMDFFQDSEGEILSLIYELNRMHSFVRDAYKNNAKDDSVSNWISDIQDIALDAEDAIEMFNLSIVNPKKSAILLAQRPNVSHQDQIRQEIKSIRSRLGAIERRREEYVVGESNKRYQIKILGEWQWKSHVKLRRRFAPWEKDERLVGVEDDVKKLLEQIIDEEKKGLSVAAVVGMRGIGKSTLAREVYNHPDVVSGRFDCRAWVVVSSEYELITQETIKQLILETTKSELEKQDLKEEIKKLVQSVGDRLYIQMKLKELLHRRLEGKTYFIVLEDLWVKEHLDSIMTALPNEKDKTSRLLLTTRIKGIASNCQSLHEMKFLDREKSWELFLKKGFTHNGSGEFPKKLEQIGRQIVEKCEGLPLSITIMGGLLAETESSKKWEVALDELESNMGSRKSLISAPSYREWLQAKYELESNMGRARTCILTILELSYWDLSSQLKCCFLYFAFFNGDASIPAKRLVNIIVGQGLIQQTEITTMKEKIARGYLDELINRNMVQVKDLTLDNRVKCCHLHDSLRELCLEKAHEEIGLENLMGDCRISFRKPRHRIVSCNDLKSFSVDQNKRIRSLFLLNVGDYFMKIESSYWKSFQHLKSLNLVCDFPLQKLPNSLQLLLGLKQLSIQRRQPNKILFSDLFNPSSSPLKLPTWLNTLKQLELLDLGIEFVEFPDVALEMDSLHYIHAYYVRGHEPIITDSWKNVKTLKYIRFEDWTRSSLSLMNGCQVRELGIIMVDESSNVSASLKKLVNLVKLYLVWNYLLPIEVAIDIPHLENLTKLKLNGMMRECPSADMLPRNLTHLTLENSFLDEDPMQKLGKLPNLLYLKLKDHSYMGERMQVLHDDFPYLIGLHLREMYELRKVVIKEGGMPQLKLLQVRDCHALDTKNLSNKSYQLQVLDTI